MYFELSRPLSACALVFSLSSPAQGGGVIVADAVADYAAANAAGDQALLPATGTGTWMYAESPIPNPGNNIELLQWDPGIFGVGAYEPFDSNHRDGVLDRFPFILRTGAELSTHPELNIYAVLRWTAGPDEGGLLDISGTIRKIDGTGGDGIDFRILVDGISIFFIVVDFDDTIGIDFAEQAVGSTVDFVIGDGDTTLYDTTGFATVIKSFPCEADLDDDNQVGPGDLAIALGTWGPCPDCRADLDEDGVVGPADLAIVLGSWGACP